MEYEESERSGFQSREEKDFAEGVHIRQDWRGIMYYAVFDGEKQVSEDYGPMEEEACISFAEGYTAGKRNYA